MRGMAMLSLGADGSPPTEFRLFVSGWNDTENGRFLFDADAAASVMAAHDKWGVDLMIDLEHQALTASTPPEPDARDARGWFRLELRADGSLWATGVTWTPDGARRIAEKRQRYVSPAFSVDPETSRVTAIINVALVAIPATHDTPALVAASARGNMDSKLIAEALDALVAGDAEKCMELLKGIITSAAGGEAAAEESAAEEPVAAAVDPAKPEEDKPEEVAAALSVVASLSGKGSLVASIANIREWHASHVALSAEREALAKREAVLEGAERRKLCVELVTLAGRAPATVWASPEAGAAPKAYLAAMPIADLRAMHADEIKANGKRPALKAPVVLDGKVDASGLTAEQARICKETGCDPSVFVALSAQRDSVRTST